MNMHYTIRLAAVTRLALGLLLCFCAPLEARKSRHSNNNNRKKKPTQTTIIKAVSAADTQSFAYYQQKTYEFLGNLNAQNRHAVTVEIMPTTDPHYRDCAGYANGSVIRLNMESFKRQSNAQNLFTCAHEAAHYACGHTYVHPYAAKRSSFVVEREADETAARMLCKHGYAWVVEECVSQLSLHMRYGDAHTSDGIHPTYAQQHEYLKTIVAHNHSLHPHAEQPTVEKPEPKHKNYTQELCIYSAICASIVVMYLKNKWYPHSAWLRI
jgi:hypothetical protein